MKHTLRNSLALCTFVMSLFALCLNARAQWTAPTAEELKMTSQPEVPGAAAVYLFREEITEDKNHMWSIYVRLKVLTEQGKEQANVELNQYHATDQGGYTVGEIEGRTIHPDGTIIPFTGKPFEKLIEKTDSMKVMAKVFTLPDVQVGSILEYRYKLRYDDHYFMSPDWYVQSQFFTRKAHYIWKPTSQTLVTSDEKGGQLTSGIMWTPILPKGTEIKQTQLPGSSQAPGQFVLELNVHDIPPIPKEEFMPPIASLSYRVLFYYTPYRSGDEFWKEQGKRWSKAQDKFIGPGPKVKAAVNDLVVSTDTPEQKLRKLYAAVMKIENMSYTRGFIAEKDKEHGVEPAKTTDDLWERKAGHSDQISELFVAMARAAGMKAYVMAVTSRDRSIFNPAYLSLSQLQDYLVIVVVDGKEMFFDPDEPATPYAHLAWPHTMVQGLRQTESGTAVANTPSEPYTASRIQRVANLTMDAHGEVAGTVKMTWTGAPAIHWRQLALRGDNTSLQRQLRESVEQLVPHGMEVKVGAIANLENYEQPLTVSFDVKGGIGSSTGKRLVIPSNLFESNSHSAFPHEKRETPVFFNYPHVVQDAVRINFPANLSLESVPMSEKVPMKNFAVYSMTVEAAPNSITTRREFDLGNILFKTEEYPDLRTFYKQVETKDQESAVLKATGPTAGGE